MMTYKDEYGHNTTSYYSKIGRTTNVERIGLLTYGNYSFVMYRYNWQDQVATYRDAGGHITKYSYDFLGRLNKPTHPDLNYNTVIYDDFRNQVTCLSYNRSSGAVTHKTVMVYDYLGRLNKTMELTSLRQLNAPMVT